MDGVAAFCLFILLACSAFFCSGETSGQRTILARVKISSCNFALYCCPRVRYSFAPRRTDVSKHRGSSTITVDGRCAQWLRIASWPRRCCRTVPRRVRPQVIVHANSARCRSSLRKGECVPGLNMLHELVSCTSSATSLERCCSGQHCG